MNKKLSGNGFKVSLIVSGCDDGDSGEVGGLTLEQIITAVFDALGIGNGLGFDSETNTIYLVANPSVGSLLVGQDSPNRIKLTQTSADGLLNLLLRTEGDEEKVLLNTKVLQAALLDISNGVRILNGGALVGLGGKFIFVTNPSYGDTGSAISDGVNRVGFECRETFEGSGVFEFVITDGNGGIGNFNVNGRISSRRKTTTLADNATSINAAECNTITVGTSGVAPVNPTIDDITDGVDNQRITILPADPFFSIVNSATIKLKSSPWLSSDDKSISLLFDGSVWWED